MKLQKKIPYFIKILSTVFMMGSLMSGPAWAVYEYKIDQKMPSGGQYESEVGAKLNRGVTNILFGWTEIMKTPVKIASDPRRGPIFSTIAGVPYGLVRFVGRTLVGAYEVVTCPAPQPPIFEPVEGNVV